MAPPLEIHRAFLRSLGPAASALVQCAIQADAAARELVRRAGFLPAQAHDVLPYLRRAEFDTRALSIVAPGVKVVSDSNPRKTSNFIEVASGAAVVTALTRSRRPRSLPKALYRETRALSSQMSLFDNEQPTGDKLYGVFVYGCDGRNLSDLSLAEVYFPLPGRPLRDIRPLDLLGEYARLVEDERRRASEIRPSEEVAELAVSLRRKVEQSKA